MSAMSPHGRGARESVEGLVEQAAWVRGLALALVRDAHAAEDVAQDAWVAALSRPPSDGGRIQGWFARVVRNLARFRSRSESHRAGRERLAAKPERGDDAALALERLEMQESLLRAVRELAEPYRTTILLRFFEGLGPAEIARRMHAPIRTVHTRITRGLALLKDRLDSRAHGDRSAWIAAWIPLLPKAASPWPWIVAMDLKLKIAVASGAALAGLTLVWIALPAGVRNSPETVTSVPAPRLDLAAPIVTDAADPEVHEHRSPAGEALRDDRGVRGSSTVPEVPPPRTVSGIVVDIEGSPVGNLEVVLGSPTASFFRQRRWVVSPIVPSAPRSAADSRGTTSPPAALTPRTPDAPTATTDARGRFEMALGDRDGALRPADPNWTTVYEPHVQRPDPSDGYVLVVARRRPISGRVVDANGNGISGAEVSCDLPDSARSHGSFAFFDELRSALSLPLDRSVAADWKTTSGEDGAFAIDDAPVLPGLVAWASSAKLQSSTRTVEENPTGIVLILQAPPERPGRLHGLVVDPEGHPVAEARVLFGTSATTTDEAGGFAFDLSDHAVARCLVAVHRDWQPVVQPCLAASADLPLAWPDPLVLAFRDRAQAIRGRVVDPEGKPLKGAEVRALDPLTYEEILTMAGETEIPSTGGHGPLFSHQAVETDEQGRFELGGLLPRLHHLRATLRSALAIGSADAVAGPTEVTIVIPVEGPASVLRGRVVDPRGKPVAGASVRARRTISEPGRESGQPLETDSVRTDGDGRFELDGISAEVDGVSVQPEDSAPGTVCPIEPGRDRRALVFVVGLLGRIQVEITTPGLEADQISVLDADGRRLQIGARRGDGAWICSEALPIVGGRTEPLLVSETAATVVLSTAWKEVLRQPVRVVPGEMVVVRP